MKPDRKRLVVLYADVAALTGPKCAECRAPNTCCAPEYCALAKDHAKEEWGVDLPVTSHPMLPFMGKTGCTVAPHLRPLCSIYVCEQHYMRDEAFAQRYFDLRDEISELSVDMV